MVGSRRSWASTLRFSSTITILAGLLLTSTVQAQSARLSAVDHRLCERLLLQTPYASPAAETMHARSSAKKLVIFGFVTFGVGYVAAFGTTLVLSLGRLATGLGANVGTASRAQLRRNEDYEHWTEPLIPLVGPFLFAGHVRDPGLVALGVTTGALQIIGLAIAIYGVWTRPASPCDSAQDNARLRVDATGLTLRF